MTVPNVNRPQFFDGQALTAADLNAVHAYQQELLWLHQRTLHSSGIVSGFAVTGAKGDKHVTVSPGYAIDVSGQSILLASIRLLDIPAVVSDSAGNALTYYLTVSYVADDQLTAVLRNGQCGSNGAVRHIDAPAFAWRAAQDISVQDIVLGKIAVQNCKLTAPVDMSPQHSALPARQPYVYAGQTHAATLKWSFWPTKDPQQQFGGDGLDFDALGVSTTVDTSAAGFVNTPNYQATVAGLRDFVVAPGGPTIFMDGYIQIEKPTGASFTLVMVLPTLSLALSPEGASRFLELVSFQWSVGWVGIEN